MKLTTRGPSSRVKSPRLLSVVQRAGRCQAGGPLRARRWALGWTTAPALTPPRAGRRRKRPAYRPRLRLRAPHRRQRPAPSRPAPSAKLDPSRANWSNAPAMARFKLTLEYAGTRYSGWQIQQNARTVAGEIDRACARRSARREVRDVRRGANRRRRACARRRWRTSTSARISRRPSLLARVNDELPQDINVLAVERVPARFHARHSAVARSYLYQIATPATAFAKPFVWWVREPLDVEAMRRAAKACSGTRDFRAFTDDDPDEKSTRVRSCSRSPSRPTGTCAASASKGRTFSGRWSAAWSACSWPSARQVDRRRERRSTASWRTVGLPARLTAPSSGLFLERVTYPGNPAIADAAPLLTLPSFGQ